jgi:hypothetical protein
MQNSFRAPGMILLGKVEQPLSHLSGMSQAARARKLASACGSSLAVELLELHAQQCERNSSTAKLCSK